MHSDTADEENICDDDFRGVFERTSGAGAITL